MKRISILIGVVGALLASLLVLPASGVGDTSDVQVVHGVPGLTVDVYVDGGKALPSFAPNTRTDAIPFPAGSYEIKVVPEGGDPATDAVITQTVEVPAAGLDIDLVAHYDGSGTPVLTAFVNDVSPTGDNKARLNARHTANAPTVDIRANGGIVFGGVSNPDGGTTEVPAATYDVDIVAAGTTSEVFQADLALAEGKSYYAYAVGNLSGTTPDFTVYLFSEELGSKSSSRLAGATRFETAVAISKSQFPEGSNTVYVARSDNQVDAVAGGVLTDGPILIVPSTGDVPQVVLDEIKRLGAKNVVALGGSAAISDEVLAQLVG